MFKRTIHAVDDDSDEVTIPPIAAVKLTDAGVSITFEEAGSTGPKRHCGGCTLCCKLVPVRDLDKPANTRCKYQRHKGCMVYRRPDKGFPGCCAVWSCGWLLNDDAADLRRPDRSHYVIDAMPDFVEQENNETGERRQVVVVQIWIDPSYPNAHRDPALRAWLERRAAHNVVGLVRYGNERALVLFPPALSENGQWNEVESKREDGVGLHKAHTPGQVAEALGGIKVEVESTSSSPPGEADTLPPCTRARGVVGPAVVEN